MKKKLIATIESSHASFMQFYATIITGLNSAHDKHDEDDSGKNNNTSVINNLAASVAFDGKPHPSIEGDAAVANESADAHANKFANSIASHDIANSIVNDTLIAVVPTRYGPDSKLHSSINDVVPTRYEPNNSIANIYHNSRVIAIKRAEEIKNSYLLNIAGIMVKYYIDDGSNAEQSAALFNEYHRVISTNQYVSSLNQIINEHQLAIDKYEISSIISNEILKCPCGGVFYIEQDIAEAQCKECGATVSIRGMSSGDDYVFDGCKIKSREFEPSRHFDIWMRRILGKEDDKLLATELDLIDRKRISEGRKETDISCELIRAYIDALKMSKDYKHHAPSIVKKISKNKIMPPNVDEDISQLRSLFIKCMGHYSVIIKNRNKRPYYPHFIYKISEHLFRDNPEKLRIIDFIHLQTPQTVKKNDIIFKKICAAANDKNLVYKPTFKYI